MVDSTENPITLAVTLVLPGRNTIRTVMFAADFASECDEWPWTIVPGAAQFQKGSAGACLATKNSSLNFPYFIDITRPSSLSSIFLRTDTSGAVFCKALENQMAEDGRKYFDLLHDFAGRANKMVWFSSEIWAVTMAAHVIKQTHVWLSETHKHWSALTVYAHEKTLLLEREHFAVWHKLIPLTNAVGFDRFPYPVLPTDHVPFWYGQELCYRAPVR